MKFVTAAVYDDYISAHLAMGRLLSENINCNLQNENTVGIYPVLTNAVGGGIQLMVAEAQIERALAILNNEEQSNTNQNE